MNRRQIILILICVVVTGMLLLFPAPVWSIRQLFIGQIFKTADYLAALKNENAVLKLEIASLKNGDLGRVPPSLTRVFVYSHYPFNVKNQIILSAGANERILPGMAVVIPSSSSTRGVFVGKIVKVNSGSSIARTIFDPEFTLAVRIGNKGTNALLTGGNEPKLTLIPKNAALVPGNIVYNASPDFTYGIPLGTLLGIRLSPDGLFQEARMNIPYDVSDLRSVGIMGK